MKNRKKPGLTTKIFIGLLAGAATGILLHYAVPAGAIRDEFLIGGIFYVVGNGFLRLMQMLVVPLVFCSLVCGSMAMGDTKKLGTIGVKTLFFYLFTTALAITAAILVANVINPGVGLDMSSIERSEIAVADKVSLPDTLLNIIPTNPLGALARGDMLPIILFALIVGIILAKLGESVETDNYGHETGALRCVLPDCKDVFRDRVRCVSAASQVYGGRASGAGRTVSGGLHDDAERLYGAESLPFYQEVSSCNGLCVFHGDLQCYNSPVHRYPSSENGGLQEDFFFYNSSRSHH